MTDRRAFLASLPLILLASARTANAQRSAPFRIGMLWPGPKNPYNDSLLAPLRALGFLEGDNLVVERRFGTPDELRSFANELVRMKVDLIHAGGSACVRAAVNATREVPIVAVDLETDPIANKYVTSLARPGGNLTGFFLDLPEFSAKRLEILKEALPKATRVVILWDASLDRAPLSKMNSAAGALHLNLSMSEIRSTTDLDTAFKGAVKQKANVVMVMQSPTLDAYRDQILSLGASHRLPIMAVFGNFAADGAILTYGPNVEDLLGRSAAYVEKVLKGAKPGDLPIQRPTKFDLVVNQKAAKALGVSIPSSVLLRADQVIS